VKSHELYKLLKKHGWIKVRQKGSHIVLKKQGVFEPIIFPFHKGKEVPTGTCKRILKQAGINE
jgi:predicted RNA binding protein YcfA (HicA-like mRNA interferase family)